ncbi:hypothetical protein [Gordonia sp. ABSL49_1]|uniref:hypothetical protein n=1 Tax=Gordonia sp. ABSL49_1 TaxID=2920941 RepID=UPI0023F38B78|nr:hypothetical protein [Gordonia sp. ABSL49_1]
MGSRHLLRRIRRPIAITVGIITATTGMGLAATTANAEPQNRTASSAPLYTLADGVCAGTVRMLAAPGPYRPGQVYVQVTGGFLGISGTSAPCRVDVRVDWRNLTRGTRGTLRGWVAGTGIPSVTTHGIGTTVTTGSGRVELRLQPDLPHLAIAPIQVTAD